MHGASRWLPLGLEMGLTLDRLEFYRATYVVDADRLQALFSEVEQSEGDRATDSLLAACRSIYPPIIGFVEEQLGKDEVAQGIDARLQYVSYCISCNCILLYTGSCLNTQRTTSDDQGCHRITKQAGTAGEMKPRREDHVDKSVHCKLECEMSLV